MPEASEPRLPDMVEGQVLSIQSHVVHGHVGNTAATFPLQVKETLLMIVLITCFYSY